MKKRDLILAILCVAGAAGYLAFLVRYNSDFAAGPDSSGYCNEAKLIAAGQMTREIWLMRALGLPPDLVPVFTPIGFVRTGRAFHMAPSYPAGQPLHQVLFAKIGGWSEAPFLVGPITGTLSVLAMIWLATELALPAAYGFAGGAILAAVPVFILHEVQSASDVPATLYAIVTIVAALRSSQPPGRRGRGSLLFALLAGVLFAIGVWIRPTNFLLVFPLAFALRWNIRRFAAAAAGAIPPGIALAWWQNVLYGSPFRTGYGTLLEVLRPTPVCAMQHARSLVVVLSPVVVLGALIVLVLRGVAPWLRIMLAVWLAVFAGFYSYYSWCDGWSSVRFLLPAMPAVIVGFLLVLRTLVDLLARRTSMMAAAAAAAIVIASVLAFQIRESRKLGVLDTKRIDTVFPECVRFAEARLPSNAIVAAGLMSGPFLYYADRETVRWDEVVLAGRLPVVRDAARRLGLEWYALESVVEARPEQFDAWKPARWVPIARDRDVTLYKLEE